MSLSTMNNVLRRSNRRLLVELSTKHVAAASSVTWQQPSRSYYHKEQDWNGGGGGTSKPMWHHIGKVVLLGAAAGSAGLALALATRKEVHASAPPLKVRPKDDVSGHKAGTRLPDLKEYSMEEVNQHDSMDKRIWVTYMLSLIHI